MVSNGNGSLGQTSCSWDYGAVTSIIHESSYIYIIITLRYREDVHFTEQLMGRNSGGHMEKYQVMLDGGSLVWVLMYPVFKVCIVYMTTTWSSNCQNVKWQFSYLAWTVVRKPGSMGIEPICLPPLFVFVFVLFFLIFSRDLYKHHLFEIDIKSVVP